MNRTAAVLLTCLALASCAPSEGGSTRADPGTQEACRVQADRVYDSQHRADIFAPMSGVNTPSSNSYAPGADSPRLGQIFARDNMIRDCVRRGGVSADPDTQVQPPAGR